MNYEEPKIAFNTDFCYYLLCKAVITHAEREGDMQFLESERSSLYKDYIAAYDEEQSRRERLNHIPYKRG